MVKLLSIALSGTLVVSQFTNCMATKVTNISTDEFVKACEKTLKYDECSIENFSYKFVETPDEGLYLALENEDLKQYGLDEDLDDAFKAIDLDDVFTIDDIESLAIAGKVSGDTVLMNELYYIAQESDIEDYKLDAAFAIQMTLSDDDKAVELMNYIADYLDKLDVDVKKDLSGQEYYKGKNEGAFRFHLSVADMASILADDDDVLEMLNVSDNDEFVDAMKELTGDIIVSCEISGENILITFGLSINTELSAAADMYNAFGVEGNLIKLPTNKKLTEILTEVLVDSVASYVAAAQDAAAAIQQHNEDIQEVTDAINAQL
jgi:hypothetical protein